MWLGCSGPGSWHHISLPGLCTLFLLPSPALHLINSYSLHITSSRKPSLVPPLILIPLTWAPMALLTYIACSYPSYFITGDWLAWESLRCDRFWLLLPGNKEPDPFIPGLWHRSAGPHQGSGAGEHHLPGQDQQDHLSADLKQPRMHLAKQQVLGLQENVSAWGCLNQSSRTMRSLGKQGPVIMATLAP